MITMCTKAVAHRNKLANLQRGTGEGRQVPLRGSRHIWGLGYCRNGYSWCSYR